MISGQWVRTQREAQGWRQSDLAARLVKNGKQGVHPGRVSEWEQERKPIESDVEQQLRRLFHAPPAD